MLSLKETVLIKIGKVVFCQKKKEANSACPYYHYQARVPEEIKKLKKYNTDDK